MLSVLFEVGYGINFRTSFTILIININLLKLLVFKVYIIVIGPLILAVKLSISSILGSCVEH